MPLLEPVGELLWAQVGQRTVGSDLIIGLSPVGEDAPGLVDVAEDVLVEALVADAAIEALDVGVLDGLAGPDTLQSDAVAEAKPSSLRLTNSGPLSVTIVLGLPRLAITSSRTATTLSAVSEKAGAMARHSRVRSSTMLSIRKRLWFSNWSAMKSMLQRSFG